MELQFDVLFSRHRGGGVKHHYPLGCVRTISPMSTPDPPTQSAASAAERGRLAGMPWKLSARWCALGEQLELTMRV